MKEDNKKHKQIKLTLNSDSNVEEYANFAITTHSPAEFVIDFFRILPGINEAKVKSRIIMSPVHLKTLVRALQDNINKPPYINLTNVMHLFKPDKTTPYLVTYLPKESKLLQKMTKNLMQKSTFGLSASNPNSWFFS